MCTLAHRRISRAAVIVALLLATGADAGAQGQRPTQAPPQRAQAAGTVTIPKIAYTDFTLANGLRVILHEDHSSPVVAVELWYNAGSKFDPKGKTGLAHMFEHMMDEGTLNMPAGEYKRVVQSAGGYYNASTSNDFVRYNTVVPANQLETVLWLEAERMANLAPTLDSTRFNLEREAVRNEYRQRILAVAPMSGGEAVFEALFPAGAYAAPLFGYQSELGAATVDDLRQFYETYYVPNNAVLVIAGDFATADTRRKVEKHFSPIPRGKPVVRPTAVTPLVGEKRLVVEHPSGNRGLWAVWRGAKTSAEDRPAAVALSYILTERLKRLLVDERRVAVVLSPFTNQHFDLQEAGVFQVAVTPTPTASATEIEQAVDSVVASIKANGVTATEVNRWIAGYRLQMLTLMQSDSSKAQNIADGTINMGRPLGFYDMVDRGQRITPADVKAAANKYLTGDRIVLSIIPTGRLDLISKPQLPYVNATRKGS